MTGGNHLASDVSKHAITTLFSNLHIYCYSLYLAIAYATIDHHLIVDVCVHLLCVPVHMIFLSLVAGNCILCSCREFASIEIKINFVHLHAFCKVSKFTLRCIYC